jgi:hypothetical protein
LMLKAMAITLCDHACRGTSGRLHANSGVPLSAIPLDLDCIAIVFPGTTGASSIAGRDVGADASLVFRRIYTLGQLRRIGLFSAAT